MNGRYLLGLRRPAAAECWIAEAGTIGLPEQSKKIYLCTDHFLRRNGIADATLRESRHGYSAPEPCFNHSGRCPSVLHRL